MRGMKGVAQKGKEFAMELGLREIIVFLNLKLSEAL